MQHSETLYALLRTEAKQVECYHYNFEEYQHHLNKGNVPVAHHHQERAQTAKTMLVQTRIKIKEALEVYLNEP